jgi:branched-chain amino acid transport system ATP-binding protein
LVGPTRRRRWLGSDSYLVAQWRKLQPHAYGRLNGDHIDGVSDGFGWSAEKVASGEKVAQRSAADPSVTVHSNMHIEEGLQTDDVKSRSEITLVNVSKRFGGVKALDSINIVMHGPGIIGVVGPNGSGKSTLLAIMSGLLAPDEGEIAINGRRIKHADPSVFARLGVARSFQHPRLVSDLRVWENIAVGSRDRQHGTDIRRICEQVGVEHVAERWPDQITLSEQRRTEVGRALASSAEIVLLDEPAAGLTELEADHLAVLLVELGRDHMIVIVEHNVELVGRVAPRAIALLEGKLAADGAPMDLWQNEALREAYLGSAAVALRETARIRSGSLGDEDSS